MVNTKRSKLELQALEYSTRGKSGTKTEVRMTIDRWPPIAFKTVPVYHIPHSPANIKPIKLDRLPDTITRQRPKDTNQQTILWNRPKHQARTQHIHTDSVVTSASCENIQRIWWNKSRTEVHGKELLWITSGIGGASGLVRTEMRRQTQYQTCAHPS